MPKLTNTQREDKIRKSIKDGHTSWLTNTNDTDLLVNLVLGIGQTLITSGHSQNTSNSEHLRDFALKKLITVFHQSAKYKTALSTAPEIGVQIMLTDYLWRQVVINDAHLFATILLTILERKQNKIIHDSALKAASEWVTGDSSLLKDYNKREVIASLFGEPFEMLYGEDLTADYHANYVCIMHVRPPFTFTYEKLNFVNPDSTVDAPEDLI